MFGGGTRTRRPIGRSMRSPPRGTVTRFPTEVRASGTRPEMRATPRFRFFNRPLGDKEAPAPRGQARYPRALRRIRSKHRSWLRRVVIGSMRHIRLIKLAAICCMTISTLWLLTQAWTTTVHAPFPPLGPMSGPDGVYPAIVIKRSRPVFPRSHDGPHQDSAPSCRNTQQGRTLLTDSEGRVCLRTRRDPLRSGCCAPPPLVHEPPSNARALFVRGDDFASDTDSDSIERVVEIVEDNDVPTRGGDNGYAAAEGTLVAEAAISPPPEAMLNPFSCWSCQAESSCCLVFEFCVSCCMDPQRAREREEIDSAAAMNGHPVYALKRAEVEARRRNIGRWSESETPSDEAFEHCVFRCRTYSGSVAHENSYRGPLKHCFGKYRPPTALGMSPNSDGSRRGELSSLRGVDRGELVPRDAAPVLHLDPYLTGTKRQ